MEEELKDYWNVINTTIINSCETKEEINKANEILSKLKNERIAMNIPEILKEIEKLQQIDILGVGSNTIQNFRTKEQLINAIEKIKQYYSNK
jgi:hypothetical protein